MLLDDEEAWTDIGSDFHTVMLLFFLTSTIDLVQAIVILMYAFKKTPILKTIGWILNIGIVVTFYNFWLMLHYRYTYAGQFCMYDETTWTDADYPVDIYNKALAKNIEDGTGVFTRGKFIDKLVILYVIAPFAVAAGFALGGRIK